MYQGDKLFRVQIQNSNFPLVVYDDDVITDLMPKIKRDKFYNICEQIKKDNTINFVDLYNRIGDVRNDLQFSDQI